MTIWFDVEDLVAYFDVHQRPSGIQRLSFQIYQAVWALAGAGGDIRFCRHDPAYSKLILIEWADLERLINRALVAPEPDDTVSSTPPPSADEPPADKRRASVPVRYLAKALLNDDSRNRMGIAYYRAPSRAEGLRLAAKAAFASVRREPPLEIIQSAPIEPAPDDDAQADLQDGDTLVALGSLWDPRFFDLLATLRAGRQFRFATMIYDLIPIILPQFTHPPLIGWYTNWLYTIVPQAEIVLTISKTSADDLLDAMRDQGLSVPPPVILPIGATPRRKTTTAKPGTHPYVLFVSTLEPRKNHALIVAVWERLLESMPAHQVPDLIFTGRVIDDISGSLITGIRHPALRDKFQIIVEPDDQVLTGLYRHCLFTVYPSFYEGWGLPVTESFSFGKTVAASNRGSLPEAGQDFCAYFDPGDLDDATAVIQGLIEHPERVAAYEAAIAARFEPPSWADTAAAVLAALALRPQPASRLTETVD